MPEQTTTTQGDGKGGEGAGGVLPAAWYPETAKTMVEGKGWKSPADVITSYTNLETLVGADKAGRTIVLPKDEKDVEGVKAFRAKLGVPEKAEDYQLPVPEGDGGELAKTAATWMLEAGVPKAAAIKVTEKWNAHIAGLVKAQQEAAQVESVKQLDALKAEWGADFDKNAEYARRFLRASGWDDAKVAKYEATFGTAAMLKDFHAWGSKTGEHGAADGDGKGGFGMSQADAQKKLDELRAERMANKISQKDFLAQAENLGKIISPEKAA